MRKGFFIAVFVGAHILFAVIHIFKTNNFISLSYEKQKKERERDALVERKKMLTQKLLALTNHTAIKEYARTKLAMEPLALKNIRKLDA